MLLQSELANGVDDVGGKSLPEDLPVVAAGQAGAGGAVTVLSAERTVNSSHHPPRGNLDLCCW